MEQFRTRRATIVLALVCLTACVGRRPGSPIKPGFNVYSKQQDIELGRRGAAEISRQLELVSDQKLQEYIKTLGQRLASVRAAEDYPYTFTLIHDKGINAFALPGGPIFVNSGLLTAAENEAQLAGVLAHEIAHVALRHGTNQASKANLLQLPAAVGGVILGQGSVAAQAGQIGLGLGLNVLMLRYSRSAESQADALGARILAEAGYNPVEMARFFEKLEAEGGSRAPQFLSSHPNPGDRLRAVGAEIQTFPRQSYKASTGQFAHAQDLVAKLPPPRRSSNQGAAQAPQLSPSGTLRDFEDNRFTIAYPDNWKAFGGADSAMVVLAPQEGVVANAYGGATIGYGALVSYYFSQSARASLMQATGELMRRLEEENPSMQVTGQSRRIKISDSPGLLSTFSSASPYGGVENNLLLTVMRPEGLFYVVFIAPQPRAEQLEATFQKMLRSIRFRG
jgi:Putative Zn-dependent protease, contains TPR repeats